MMNALLNRMNIQPRPAAPQMLRAPAAMPAPVVTPAPSAAPQNSLLGYMGAQPGMPMQRPGMMPAPQPMPRPIAQPQQVQAPAGVPQQPMPGTDLATRMNALRARMTY